jgi:hypothetical protein
MSYIRRMGGVRQWILAACVIGSALNGLAEARPGETYNSIVARNAFGLKDPPVKETNAPPPQPQPKKEDFYLTGISTIGNPKKPKAYLLAKDQSKKDYEQKYYNLAVGDRQGDITLNEVDTKGRRVKITYQGEEKWLSMKDNGVPTPVGPMVNPGMHGGVPGVPGMPQMQMQKGVPMPPGMAIPQPNMNPNPNGKITPGQPQNQPLYPNAGNTTRRPMRSMPAPATSPAPPAAAPQTDAEILRTIIESQNPDKVNSLPAGTAPPSPPPLPLPGM